MLEAFRKMVNDCIRIGLSNSVSTRGKLCQLSYHQLSRYDTLTYYKLCAISRAAGVLANRRKSIKRGYRTKDPYMKKSILISCYGFKIVNNEILRIPIGNGQHFNIQLNDYSKRILASEVGIRIRSFTLTLNHVSICYIKEVKETSCCTTAAGIDRNLENVTVGNSKSITQYNFSKAIQITSNTRDIIKSFKRNDVRIRKKIAAKYGQRKRDRVNHLLHNVSKIIVEQATHQKTALVFEDIRHIRKLYGKGNYQGAHYRGKMNSWPYYELERQIKYKAVWHGISIIQLSKAETRDTSRLCPHCGKRTQGAERHDKIHARQLWCSKCEQWQDRDVIAATNIAYKGLARFVSPQGAADEAMVQESVSKELVILKVDAAKLNPKRLFERSQLLTNSVTSQNRNQTTPRIQ